MAFLALPYFHNYLLNDTNFGEIVLHAIYIWIFSLDGCENFRIYGIIEPLIFRKLLRYSSKELGNIFPILTNLVISHKIVIS